jgi:hypothetical protein
LALRLPRALYNSTRRVARSPPRRPPRAAAALLAPRHLSRRRELLARIGLGTFETAHEAARAYDSVAWRLGRPRWSMNFDDVKTRAQAEMLAPPPPAVTREQRQR